MSGRWKNQRAGLTELFIRALTHPIYALWRPQWAVSSSIEPRAPNSDGNPSSSMKRWTNEWGCVLSAVLRLSTNLVRILISSASSSENANCVNGRDEKGIGKKNKKLNKTGKKKKKEKKGKRSVTWKRRTSSVAVSSVNVFLNALVPLRQYIPGL